MGIIDPPRQGVLQSIITLTNSGVDVKMITGDARETATAICAKIGLNSEPKRILSGEQLESMDYDGIKRIINDVSKNKYFCSSLIIIMKYIKSLCGEILQNHVKPLALV